MVVNGGFVGEASLNITLVLVDINDTELYDEPTAVIEHWLITS